MSSVFLSDEGLLLVTKMSCLSTVFQPVPYLRKGVSSLHLVSRSTAAFVQAVAVDNEAFRVVP